MQDNLPDQPRFENWLAIKEKELENNGLEIKLRFQQDENQFKYATQILATKAAGMSERFRHEQSSDKYRFLFFGFIALLVSGVIGVSVYSGHTDVAIEIIKMISYGGLGAFGGYGFSKVRQKSKDAPQEDD